MFSIVIAALALQAAPVKAEATPAPVDAVRRAALIEYFGQVGSLAYHLGQCERFLPAGEGDRFVASVLRQDAYAEVPEFQTMLRSSFAALYAEGRTDPARLTLTANSCERMIKGATADAEAEGAKLRDILRSPVSEAEWPGGDR